jgi:hypothetical protein
LVSGGGLQNYLDILYKTFNKCVKKAVEVHFGSHKHTYKRNKLGFQTEGARLGVQIAVQKIKISSISKTFDMSD